MISVCRTKIPSREKDRKNRQRLSQPAARQGGLELLLHTMIAKLSILLVQISSLNPRNQRMIRISNLRRYFSHFWHFSDQFSDCPIWRYKVIVCEICTAVGDDRILLCKRCSTHYHPSCFPVCLLLHLQLSLINFSRTAMKMKRYLFKPSIFALTASLRTLFEWLLKE